MSIRLTPRPLPVAAAWRELEGPGAGGVVVFVGRIRPDVSPRGRVVAVNYEAHTPVALARFRALDARARRRFGAIRVVLWHRVGRVRTGEASVVVGAACGHRAEAFAAARYLIEDLKATVPIWKTERARSVRPPRPRRGRRAARSSG